MLRRFAITIALALLLWGTANAGGPSPEGLDLRLRTSQEFLKAASRIVSENGSREEAAAILKLAEESYKEALGHFKTGEYEFAQEDLNDTTRKAMHAIILAKNANDSAIKEVVMREEVALLAEREHELKEARLKKGMDEVEIFMKTAERLLKDRPNEAARLKLDETRATYAAAKEKIAAGDYDSALAGVSKAYKLATAAVKEIKRSQDDILTFPKAVFTEPREALAYELKKNDAYAFFASSMIKEGQAGPSRLLSEGLAMREKALKTAENGGEAAAIEGLKDSTELLIKAIKASGQETGKP